MVDPYAVLGIAEGFTFKELSDSYRAAAEGADSGAVALRRAASAFEVLSRGAVGRGCPAARRTVPMMPRSPLAAKLSRLKRALQGVEKPVRQRKLQEMSSALRMELLRYMEFSSISETSSLSARGSCGLQQNRRGLFRAKMNLEHISLYSSFTTSADAVEHHIFLVRLRQLVASNLKRGLDIAEAFQEAFSALEEADLLRTRQGSSWESTKFSSFLHQQGFRTYLNIHVSRWLGSTHVTSPVLPFTQILDLRKRLLIARQQGWDAFRAEWISMMQNVGLSRTKKRLGNAGGIADIARRKVLKNPRKRSHAGLKFRVARPEVSLHRAVKSAEAALAKLARLKRKFTTQI